MSKSVFDEICEELSRIETNDFTGNVVKKKIMFVKRIAGDVENISINYTDGTSMVEKATKVVATILQDEDLILDICFRGMSGLIVSQCDKTREIIRIEDK